MLEQNKVSIIDFNCPHCQEVLERFIGIHQAYWKGCTPYNTPVILKTPPTINPYQYPFLWPKGRYSYHSIQARLELNITNCSDPFSLFISIPFCRVRCKSCAFFKNLLPRLSGREEHLENYIKSLSRQTNFVLSSERFCKRKCTAIYIGGGTPSVLPVDILHNYILELNQHLSVTKTTEITLEINPFDLTEKYVKTIINAGINRISLGYQSSQEDTLRVIGSPHYAINSDYALKTAVNIGVHTVNIDFMYGVPGQSLDSLQKDFEKVVGAQPQSITLYRYKVISDTCSKNNKWPQSCVEDNLIKWYISAKAQLEMTGYREYRYGNFSKNGHEQIYNRASYALDQEGIGIGAGAYGFINGYMYRIGNNQNEYISRINNKQMVFADFISHQATVEERMIRYVIHNLFYGCVSLRDLSRRFGKGQRDIFITSISELNSENMLVKKSENVHVSDIGRWHMDKIVRTIISTGTEHAHRKTK